MDSQLNSYICIDIGLTSGKLMTSDGYSPTQRRNRADRYPSKTLDNRENTVKFLKLEDTKNYVAYIILHDMIAADRVDAISNTDMHTTPPKKVQQTFVKKYKYCCEYRENKRKNREGEVFSFIR